MLSPYVHMVNPQLDFSFKIKFMDLVTHPLTTFFVYLCNLGNQEIRV
jgi:hypothetical protein